MLQKPKCFLVLQLETHRKLSAAAEHQALKEKERIKMMRVKEEIEKTRRAYALANQEHEVRSFCFFFGERS